MRTIRQVDHLELKNDFRRKRKYFTIRRFRRQSRNGPHPQSQGCHHHHRHSLRHRVGHRYHRQYHLQYQEFHHRQCLCPRHLHQQHHHHRHQCHGSRERRHYRHQNHQHQKFHHHQNPVLRPQPCSGGRKDSVQVPTTSF